MKKNEYLKYVLQALIDGSKNFRIFFNIVICLIVFILLSKTSFVPSGLDINFLNQFRKTKERDKKTEPIDINNPIYYNLKDYSSGYNTNSSKSRKIVFLLVTESLGRIDGVEILEKLKKELFSNIESKINDLNNIEYEIKEIPNIISKGGTLRTEMEFLCDFSSYQYRKILDKFNKMSKEEFKDCIPNIYKKKGFKTIYNR